MKTSEINIIDMHGTPYQRGCIYGESARKPIAEVLEHWIEGLNALTADEEKKQPKRTGYSWQEFLKHTRFTDAIKKWAPELLQEVQGIADASNQSFDKLLALQLIDEEWVYGLQQQHIRPSQKCTAFGLFPGRGTTTFAGQNMDVAQWAEGYQTLLKIRLDAGELQGADPIDVMVFTIAGIIGLNGINSVPLGVTCNTLAQLDASQRGVPVSFIVRKVLAQRSFEEAERVIQQIPHASGQNYMLSTAGRVSCFECSANQVVQYKGDTLNSITHTNHPLENDDISGWQGLLQSRLENSTARLLSIQSNLNEMAGSPTLDKLKRALSAHDDPANPVCRCINHGRADQAIGYTAGSSIYEFDSNAKLHLASGPPCSTSFHTFYFGRGQK